jgi:hypothetical protein
MLNQGGRDVTALVDRDGWCDCTLMKKALIVMGAERSIMMAAATQPAGTVTFSRRLVTATQKKKPVGG